MRFLLLLALGFGSPVFADKEPESLPEEHVGEFLAHHPLYVPKGDEQKDGRLMNPTVLPLKTLLEFTGKTRPLTFENSFVDAYQKSVGKKEKSPSTAKNLHDEIQVRDRCSGAEFWVAIGPTMAKMFQEQKIKAGGLFQATMRYYGRSYEQGGKTHRPQFVVSGVGFVQESTQPQACTRFALDASTIVQDGTVPAKGPVGGKLTASAKKTKKPAPTPVPKAEPAKAE